jgi:protein-S-isoprenylcysteine O-methyltransferase Ste14
MGDNRVEPTPASWRFVVRQLLAFPFVLGLILFLPAGRLDWIEGWLFLLISTAILVALFFYMRRVNPEIFAARRRIHKGTKLWDRIVLAFLLPTLPAEIVVAALDAGRFGWSHLSLWCVAVGYLFYVGGFILASWAEAVNRFFEPGVRIQTERGHHVIDTGPYAYVRHPGYVGACILLVGAALSLGSLWALVPAAAAIAGLVLRTALEDRTLRRELPGYQEYSQRVRFRLIPGLW